MVFLLVGELVDELVVYWVAKWVEPKVAKVVLMVEWKEHH